MIKWVHLCIMVVKNNEGITMFCCLVAATCNVHYGISHAKNNRNRYFYYVFSKNHMQCCLCLRKEGTKKNKEMMISHSCHYLEMDVSLIT